ncbi:MAG: radical SAM protein [Candidatus Riflebacteria bacterium]|nr:radical SAM protein [Candidatus Riflebacteria bacterium]
MHPALKFLVHQGLAALGRQTFRFPFGAFFYLTYRCNLRCRYCDVGIGRAFPTLTAPELPPEGWRTVMAAVRPHTDVLLLSGGEPLLYPGFRQVVADARRLGFSFLSLNTNGLLLEPDIIDAVDAIIISLDSLDRQRSDRLWNRAGATDRVLGILDGLAGRRHPSVMVNSVILPGNLADLEAVLDFCVARGITFSAGPALAGNRPVAGLAGNPDFHRLVGRILAAKRAGKRIAASVDYWRALPRFPRFSCHPLLVWRFCPDGSLLYPCSRLHRTIGTLAGGADPVDLLTRAAGGPFFEAGCGEACPLSCYMDTSRLVRRPLSLLREGLYRLRAFSRGHRMVF